ncbi:DUF707 domain-containing protein [Paenibacillus cremeus]|uniref:DUF707 domain-containing protein n=1 Tax=Paenibacillus cremeus TaxID=2163881 RepID=A0A559KI76_9BACL|nr:DUF707 domain-containing protein [Paenibacillus cremeus]TVY11831.1 DUF707 domain-containing protein [Paenibacillus cremeus]
MYGFGETSDKRYLVIANVGDDSLHHEWLVPGEHKNFDLCLWYFGQQPGRYETECDYYFAAPGYKYPTLKRLVESYGEQIFRYDAIWLPDEDISASATTINRMFELFREQGFQLAQPALTRDSYYSHQVTVVNEAYRFRYSHFVEVMAPIFSRESFMLCWPSFDWCESGWGLDLIWPMVISHPHRMIGVLDETPVRHTRPIGGGMLYKKLARSPVEEMNELSRRFGFAISTYGLPHYDGVPSGLPAAAPAGGPSRKRRRKGKKIRKNLRRKYPRLLRNGKAKARKGRRKRRKRELKRKEWRG